MTDETNSQIKYLSLFSGIGGFEHGLLRVKPEAVCIGFSEIAKRATAVYKKQWPQAHAYGDVCNITRSSVLRRYCERCAESDTSVCETHADPSTAAIDLLLGGSPCQDFSPARTDERKGFEGKKSCLMMEFFRLVNELRPKVFVLENIGTMLAKDAIRIDRQLKCGHVSVDASRFTSQSRVRHFWTNASEQIPPVTRKGPAFREMLDAKVDAKEILNTCELSKLYHRLHVKKYNRTRHCKGGILPHVKTATNIFTGLSYSFKKKSATLMRSSSNRTTNMLVYDDRLSYDEIQFCSETNCRLPWRRMSVAECHRLQGFSISETARTDAEALDENLNRRERVAMLGDAVCVDVAEYLFRYIYDSTARNSGQLSVSRMFARTLEKPQICDAR
eukprot:gene31757-40034_t